MRLIDADKFQEFIRENCADSLVELWCELVRRQPTIEAVPVVKAHWHSIYKNNMGVKVGFCSNCGHQKEVVNNYCGNCGAKMEEGAE